MGKLWSTRGGGRGKGASPHLIHSSVTAYGMRGGGEVSMPYGTRSILKKAPRRRVRIRFQTFVLLAIGAACISAIFFLLAQKFPDLESHIHMKSTGLHWRKPATGSAGNIEAINLILSQNGSRSNDPLKASAAGADRISRGAVGNQSQANAGSKTAAGGVGATAQKLPAKEEEPKRLAVSKVLPVLSEKITEGEEQGSERRKEEQTVSGKKGGVVGKGTPVGKGRAVGKEVSVGKGRVVVEEASVGKGSSEDGKALEKGRARSVEKAARAVPTQANRGTKVDALTLGKKERRNEGVKKEKVPEKGQDKGVVTGAKPKAATVMVGKKTVKGDGDKGVVGKTVIDKRGSRVDHAQRNGKEEVKEKRVTREAVEKREKMARKEKEAVVKPKEGAGKKPKDVVLKQEGNGRGKLSRGERKDKEAVVRRDGKKVVDSVASGVMDKRAGEGKERAIRGRSADRVPGGDKKEVLRAQKDGGKQQQEHRRHEKQQEQQPKLTKEQQKPHRVAVVKQEQEQKQKEKQQQQVREARVAKSRTDALGLKDGGKEGRIESTGKKAEAKKGGNVGAAKGGKTAAQ